MEKDNLSGHPNHISPLESRSGSSPENTVTDASDTVATFKVRIKRGAIAEVSPPNINVTINKYPVCENTPIPNKNNTRPATFAKIVVNITNIKHPNKNTRLFANQGTIPKNRYQTKRILGSLTAMTVSSFP